MLSWSIYKATRKIKKPQDDTISDITQSREGHRRQTIEAQN